MVVATSDSLYTDSPLTRLSNGTAQASMTSMIGISRAMRPNRRSTAPASAVSQVVSTSITAASTTRTLCGDGIDWTSTTSGIAPASTARTAQDFANNHASITASRCRQPSQVSRNSRNTASMTSRPNPY